MHLQHAFGKRKPVLLIVMDGWGLGQGGEGDAIAAANTPVFDRLWLDYAHTQLMTHGAYVGLPAAQDMGGSEVGHLTMGAGMILDQGPTRINKALTNGSFYDSDVLQQVMQCGLDGGTLHLVGLLSDGNIHSHLDHFLAVICYAAERGVKRLRVHALLDGRDVGIQTAQDYVEQVETVFARINAAEACDYAFASGGGREYMTMDRDQNWNKVARGWNAMVHGKAEHVFPNMMAAIHAFRAQDTNIVDQDLPDFVIANDDGIPCGKVCDGDAVVMMNFRADRAIELTEAFCLDDFDGFDRGVRPNALYAGMMVYDEDRNLPALQLMGSTKVAMPLGKRLLEQGLRQFRLAETQKYPHVTFFFNGGYRQPLDESMEDYVLIPSDKDVTFSDAPAMKAVEVGDKAVELVLSGNYDFGLINFANADMVGHCGAMKPVIEAVEAVDTAVGKILDALTTTGGMALITADHGNAEEMTVTKNGKLDPSTKHTINPVPCILFDPEYKKGSYQLRSPRDEDDISSTPGLSHIAATVLNMLDMDVPDNLAPSLVMSNS